MDTLCPCRLSARERRTLAALLETLVAGDRALLEAGDRALAPDRAALWMARMRPPVRLAFRAALFALEYPLPPLSWHGRRFTALTIPERLERLERWETSPLYFKKNLLLMLHLVTFSAHLSDDAVLHSLGYGPVLEHRRSAGDNDSRTCPCPMGDAS